MRLNLGCSTQHLEGFIGVDRWTPPWATEDNFVRADLRHSWPFADHSIEHIRAHDIVEHLEDRIHTMNEIHRILKPGGMVDIVVPTTDGRGAFQDPTHVSYWNRNSFFYFTEGDPHYTRFHEAYGVRGAFKVLQSKESRLADGVTKLEIMLEAVETGKVEQGEMENENQNQQAPAPAQPMPPVFSILHATAHRLPYAWVDTWREWSKKASYPQAAEYIVSVHVSDIEKVKEGAASIATTETGIPIVVVAQDARYCAVDNWNQAAAASKGKVLIMGADDFFPPQNWDGQLATSVPSLDAEFVIHVSTGSMRDEDLIVHPIMSRALYQRWGYFMYPAYEGVYCDTDCTAHAKVDGVVIDARHIRFDHRNPMITGKQVATLDEGYKAQNSAERYATGKQIFDARVQCGFKDVKVVKKKTIALALPGESFSSSWVLHLSQLLLNLTAKYNVLPFFAYSSNVYITRSSLTKFILEQQTPTVDYVLWIDDDNLVTPEQVYTLLQDLEEHPEYDSVSGWCWIQPDGYAIDAKVSCGIWAADGSCHYLSSSAMLSSDTPDLLEVEWTGFPVVLMRRETLVKAGENPFSPFPTPHQEFGFSGEDTAFCRAAKDRGGCRFAVDRRVKVPHMKLRPAEPNDIATVMNNLVAKKDHAAV